MKNFNFLLHKGLIKAAVLFMFAALLGTFAHGACVANFTYSVNQVTKTVTFTNTSTGSNLRYLWKFGDGDTSSQTNPTHTYASSGSDTVCLTVTSTTDSLCFSKTCKNVNVGVSSCIASFTYNINPVTKTVSFHSNSTGSNLAYSWIGIGGSTGANPSYTFPATGLYNVCLNVTSTTDSSCQSQYCVVLNITGVTCVANFTYTVNQATKTVTFNNISSDSNLTYSWNFGDTTALSTVKNPVHTYPYYGTFYVCLKVKSNYDSTCVNTKCMNVLINPPAQPCVADFTYTINPTTHTATFTSTSTGSNLVYTWIGIGGSTGTNPTYTFPAVGSYNVCLMIRNALDSTCTSSKCSTIVVTSPTPCLAVFGFSRDSLTPLKLYFVSSGSAASNIGYFWNFGDGFTSTSANPNHQYTAAGTYNVCLTVRNTLDTTCINTKCISITVGSATSCVANFSFSINQSTRNVTFTNTSTGSNLSYHWNFGDGTTSAVKNPAHTYPVNGLYRVCLTVVNTLDTTCVNTKCDYIAINSTPCIADFGYTIDSASDYHFHSSSSGSGLEYLWVFGDGAISTLADPVHHYIIPRPTYEVCLTVRNPLDTFCFDRKCITINLDHPCAADFNYYPVDSIRNPGMIHFVNTSSGTGLSYSWSFGDGQHSSAQHPDHQYSNIGFYHVCLTINGPDSCHDTKCMDIFVHGNPCTATFGYYYDSISPGRTVHFYPQYGQSGTTYSWSFGDSNSSTQMYPIHLYGSTGVFIVCLTVTDTLHACHATNCDSVFVYGSSGLDEQDALQVTAIYPNPFSDKVHVELYAKHHDTGELIITDAVGRIQVKNKITLESGTNTYELDLAMLNQGVYFVELRTQEQTIVKRILK